MTSLRPDEVESLRDAMARADDDFMAKLRAQNAELRALLAETFKQLRKKD